MGTCMGAMLKWYSHLMYDFGAVTFQLEPGLGKMGRLPASSAASAARTETAP